VAEKQSLHASTAPTNADMIIIIKGVRIVIERE
jgi:hypothetical protein